MPARDFVRDAKAFLEIVEEVPGAMHAARAWAERLQKTAAGGERAYARTHGGRKHEAEATSIGEEGTAWIDGYPDPRKGTTMMGRLESISYVTEKGRSGEVLYQHHFGPRARTRECEECGNWVRVGDVDVSKLPILGFTWAESPAGLVVARDVSAYKVTAHGIEG